LTPYGFAYKRRFDPKREPLILKSRSANPHNHSSDEIDYSTGDVPRVPFVDPSPYKNPAD
jgi:hypothetical protein